MVGPRDYTTRTRTRLTMLSGGQCYRPECGNILITDDGEVILSQYTHIAAASKNGPRYDPNMSDNDRRGFNNLILLCKTCHKIIDDKEEDYPVNLLKDWKKTHERKTLSKLSANTSLLRTAVIAISKLDLDETTEMKNNSAIFNVDDKIKYNCIKENKSLIEEYKIFYEKISSLYKELDKHDSFQKHNLFNNIRKIYLKIKGKYVKDSKNPMQIVQENADNIIEDIEEKLISSISEQEDLPEETISICVSIIMVDAFIRCKILEAPPK